MENLRLNVALLRRKVPNLTSAARSVGLRPATVSNLCTGKIPVGRAEVRTIAALASLAECSLDELILMGESVDVIETKIKALDFFAPVVKGGTIGLVARPGMGQVVLLSEIFYRLKREGYVTVVLKPDASYPELQELLDDADAVVHTIEEAYETMAALPDDKDIVFSADRAHVVTGELYELQERLQKENLTTFLVDLKGEVVDEEIPYGPLETLLHFDADLSARHIFPALNPIYSTSSVLEGAYLDQNHLNLLQRAQKLLRRYRELRSLVSVRGLTGIPSSELQTYSRGERLEAYLTQPFYVAEEFTGTKAETVSLSDTLNDIRTILEGGADERSPEELKYIGRL
ncbi:hypothetical protein [Peribacillus sp. SCS-37]|uniref:hypothetical protein n=1 Tax=Paraperibacillus esterisolvens TaxID=3115296 RepID=UPI003905DEF2